MKATKILALLMAVVMVFALAACAKTDPTPTTKGTEAANDTKTTEPAASGETTGSDEILPAFGKKASDIGVVLVVNTNLGDHAICDLSNEGLQEAAAKYGFRTKVVELGGDVTLQVPTFTEYAEDPDWDIIITGTPNMKEALQTVAKEYPEQKFILYDAQDDLSLPNVASLDHCQNEGAYLAGVAAALLTTSDAKLANDKKIVGFVGGGENTALDDYLIGYIQGVHSVDEDINILVSWIGDFKDTAQGQGAGCGSGQPGR